MYARKQLDFSYRDLLAAVGHTLRPGLRREIVAADLEKLWSAENDAIAALSVRTLFDAYLSVLSLPRGSEVLMTGVNIPDMVQIVHAHGLVVVPVDLNMRTLEVKRGAVKRALTSRTRLIVAAHLFGARMDMDPVFRAVTDRPEIRVVEDCAQAFRGIDRYNGDARSDISLFSFGSIKTASALGGAMARVRTGQERGALRNHLSKYPERGRAGFIWRTIKYGFLKTLGQPVCYRLFVRACELLRVDFDELVIAAVRNFKASELLLHIRQQPPAAQLALLLRRLHQSRKGHLDGRIAAGNIVRDGLREFVDIHGVENGSHTYWLFPVRCADKGKLVADLRAAGFDATSTSTQLQAIAPDAAPDKPARECNEYIRDTVYLPVYAGLPSRQLNRLISVIRDASSQIPVEKMPPRGALKRKKSTARRVVQRTG